MFKPMNPTLKSQIESLCAKVQEVIDNNDWPTEEGHCIDTGVTYTCPLQELVGAISAGILET